MMKVEFSTDNAAFGEGNELHEAATILRKIADRLDRLETEGRCMDSNGNGVGTWELEFSDTHINA